MTCMLQSYHYSLIFTSFYIGIVFIPAAELRGIQINKNNAIDMDMNWDIIPGFISEAVNLAWGKSKIK